MAHCLFCQLQIISSNLEETSPSETETGTGSETTFGRLCYYLNIKISRDWRRQYRDLPQFTRKIQDDNDDDSGDKMETTTCMRLLCLKCFELVDELRKVYEELEKIKREIVVLTNGIRRVITKEKAGVEAAAEKLETAPRKRGRPKKVVTVKQRELEFLQEFQTLVKESVNLNEQSTSEDTRNKIIRKPSRISDEINEVIDGNCTSEDVLMVLKEEPVDDTEVKIEVDPEDLHNASAISDTEEYELGGADESFYGSNADRPVKDSEKSEAPYRKKSQAVDNAVDRIKRRSKRVSRLASSAKRQHHKDTSPPTADVTCLSPLKPKLKLKRPTKSVDKGRPASGHQLTCRYCHAKFSSPHKYYTHRKSHLPLHSKSLHISTEYGIKNGRKRVVARLCSICGHRVNGHQLAIFMEHMLSHEHTAVDLSLPTYPCDKCDKQFNIKLNLDLHRICNHEWNHVILKCDTCGDTSCKTQAEFVLHLKSHDSVTNTHSCKSCPMACTSLDKLLVHMVKHSQSKRLYCPECPSFVSPTLKELYQHCTEVHPELKEKFNCTQLNCTKSFLIPATLRRHLKITHGIGEEDDELEEYFCAHCTTGKIYKSKRSLEKHVRFYHGDEGSRPHKCEICQKTFVYKSLLLKHIQEKHDRIRYPCPHCPKSYSEQIQLGHHMKIHTGEGLFTCSVCGKQFPRQGQLKVHSVVHLEKNAESSCVCEICGKEFGNELHLRKHKSSHKEKKLKCPHCQLMFRRPDHLKSHLRTHTGERPFVCPVQNCTKGFNRRDIMIVHMKIHGMSQEEAVKCYKQHLENMKEESC